ncbi:hypothetical protein WJX73_007147 [Symbiochloris irregularis]|uniref:Protein kinase domain-containing protein n=1 Tax=Symbiochloris irregularis TaxID=706552 RepID=A0AAW1P2E4_9CHLO
MGACGSKPPESSPQRGGGKAQGGAAAGRAAPAKPKEPTIERPTRKLVTGVKFRDVYKIGKTLGTGGFAVVKLATNKQTGEEYAVKIMNLPDVSHQPANDNENTREDIFKEIDILVGMEHENVLNLKEYYEEGGKVYLITEVLYGGELLDAVLERGSYSEADARLCFVQLLKGITYLHSKGVVHRDLKLENLLLANQKDMTRIKIADFGLAKKAAETAMDTICGTPQYVAPEVIQGTPGLMYGKGVDLWSAGVVLFILLGGYPPFFDESEPALFNQIRKGSFTFDDPVWDTITADAKNLISSLLSVDASKRLTAEQALNHPWIQGTLHEPAQLNRTRDNMRKHLRSRWKAAVQTIVAQNRLANISKLVAAGQAQPRSLVSNSEDIRRMTEAAKRLEETEGRASISEERRQS